jgi:phosphoethanolamine N-methyltransferase
MTLIFGEGFLSPGGAGEVKRIIDSRIGPDQLAGHKVIDWGSGLGGTALALVEGCGADDVTGIDIEPGNIELSRQLVERHGCGDRIDFLLVEPGPMPLDGASVEVLFTKEALCHIDDKPGVFADFLRVLQPGGVFIGSDWMTGADDVSSEAYQAWDNQLRSAGLDFTFESIVAHRRYLEEAGFADVVIEDDTPWTLVHGEGYVDRLHGEEGERLVPLMGEEGLADLIVRCAARVEAMRNGDLRRCHMSARKPAV